VLGAFVIAPVVIVLAVTVFAVGARSTNTDGS
jgi:hypothetical protein